MYYIKAKVKEIIDDLIVIENNDIGYIGHYIGENNLTINSEASFYYLSYTGLYTNEDLYFDDIRYYKYAKHLLDIKNIGVKTVLDIFKEYKPDELDLIISSLDYSSLNKVKNISNETSKKIINDLNYKLFNTRSNSKKVTLIQAMKKLGYSSKDIIKISSKLDFNKNYEFLVKRAIEELAKVCMT